MRSTFETWPGRRPHPHRQLHCALRIDRGIDSCFGEAPAATTPSPVWLNKNSSCASRAARIASASASRRRVEPSISVNKGHDPRLHNPRGHPQRMSHQPLSQAANRDRLSRLSYHFARAHLRALANARVSHNIDACSSSNNHDPLWVIRLGAFGANIRSCHSFPTVNWTGQSVLRTNGDCPHCEPGGRS